jgi:hypothetical protein
VGEISRCVAKLQEIKARTPSPVSLIGYAPATNEVGSVGKVNSVIPQ